MVNFNLEGLENLNTLEGMERLFEGNFKTALTTLGALAIFLAIIAGILVILCYIFGSIGLMNLAKKNNIPNPWLAFIPIGRSYIIGKLGFEVYNKENKNARTFMWVTLGLGAASFVLGNSSGDLDKLIEYALLFFESWAFYNIFKALTPKNSVVYTVFTVLSGTTLGGIFLYFMRVNEEPKEEKNTIQEEMNTEVKKDNKEETKKENQKYNFCPNCGAKLTKDTKFCPECGKKVI